MPIEPLVIQGNALNLPVASSSVDLIVTSPPYFALRSYEDKGTHTEGQAGAEGSPKAYIDTLVEATREMVRVLKPSGSIFVNLGDKYARTGGVDKQARGRGRSGDPGSRGAPRLPQRGIPGIRDTSLAGLPWRYAIRCIDDLALILRAEIIWNKPNALPETVKTRVRRVHETWFHFVMAPKYYTRPGAALGTSVTPVALQPLRVPDEMGVKHFAAFPVGWPLRLIQDYCPEGGLVLDPFGGTGTTALAASALGRQAITVDLSADYGRVAQWRVSDPEQRAKALTRG